MRASPVLFSVHHPVQKGRTDLPSKPTTGLDQGHVRNELASDPHNLLQAGHILLYH